MRQPHRLMHTTIQIRQLLQLMPLGRRTISNTRIAQFLPELAEDGAVGRDVVAGYGQGPRGGDEACGDNELCFVAETGACLFVFG